MAHLKFDLVYPDIKCVPSNMSGEDWACFKDIVVLFNGKAVGNAYLFPLKQALVLTRLVRFLNWGLKLDSSIKHKFFSKIANLAEQDINRIVMSDLFQFQKEDAIWLLCNRRGLVGSQMGTGKTPLTLMAIPEGRGVLVVCPACVKGVWLEETKRWRPDFEPKILSGKDSFRWPNPNELLIINYDVLPAKPSRPPDSVVLIGDEAHYIKTSKSKRTKAFRALVKHLPTSYIWLLTGTPVLNTPLELWNLFYALNIHLETFTSWPNFIRLFRGQKNQWGGLEWGRPHPTVPLYFAKGAIRRKRKEVLPYLPDKLYQTIPISIDNNTKLSCDKILEEAQKLGIDLDSAIEEAKKKDSTLFELLAHARKSLATAKIPALIEQIELCEDSQEPLLVFSAHLDPIKFLGERFGWKIITGDQTAEERAAIVHEFQTGQLLGLGLTIQAGGLGLTLTRSHHQIFVDLVWTPALNEQASDRAYRIGQEHNVLIQYLVAEHPVDEHLFKVLSRKQQLLTTIKLD